MALETRLMLSRDQSGAVDYGVRPYPSFEYNGTLVPNAMQSITLPEVPEPNIPWRVFINYTNTDAPPAVWVTKTDAGVSPATPDLPTTTVGPCNSWLNPASWVMTGGQSLSFKSTNTAASISVIVFLGNVGN